MDERLDLDKVITVDSILFFDLDGTLIDTDFANFLSYKKAFHSVTQNGFNLSYNPKLRFNRKILKVSFPHLSQVDYERIIQEKEEYFKDYLHETKLNTKIAEILLMYSKTNKTVLVTNCRKERALMTLNHFGLTDKFSYFFFRMLTDKGVKINKFQNAISNLGVSPKLVIAFENEEMEIVDAKQAGINIINPKIDINE